MDDTTVNYYSKNAQAVAARYESVVSSLSESFQDAFKARSKLLDIGSGSGRDLALLVSFGHDCFGLDATPEFVELSQTLHPELKGKIVQGALPDFDPPFGGKFDGILCSAVLMHIPEDQLVPAAQSIKRCLKKGGRLFPYYSPKALHEALDSLMHDTQDFCWKEIELFLGTTP
jgi:SAM-dependent methyltransferase